MKKNTNKAEEMIEVMVDTTITYSGGYTEFYEAVTNTDKGIIIGRIYNSQFVPCGYIFKSVIQEMKIKSKINCYMQRFEVI